LSTQHQGVTIEDLAARAIAKGARLGDDPASTIREYVARGVLRPAPSAGPEAGAATFDDSHVWTILLIGEDLKAGYTLDQVRERMGSNVYLSERGLSFVRSHRGAPVPEDAFVPGRALTRGEMAVILHWLIESVPDPNEVRRLLGSMLVLDTGEPAVSLDAFADEWEA